MAQPASSILLGEELKHKSQAMSHISLLSGGEGGKIGIVEVELVVCLKQTDHVVLETCLLCVGGRVINCTLGCIDVLDGTLFSYLDRQLTLLV